MTAYHRLCGLNLVLSLVLISLGGFVHNTDSSLACPDWPLCFGQVFPEMKGSVAIEHSHRLLATLVGILSIALVFLASRLRYERPQLFKVSIWALGLVIFQGLLGGLTVLLKISPMISTVHLGTSQIFLAILTWLFWQSAQHRDFAPSLPVKSQRFLRITAVLLYLQMLLGASIRHGGAGVACGVGPEAAFLCLNESTAEPVFWPLALMARAHMAHRYSALLVAIFIFLSAFKLWRFPSKTFRLLALSMTALVLLQIAMGLLTISSGIGLVPVSLHLVFAALLWFVICSTNFLMTSEKPAGKFQAPFSEPSHA